jgi:hypothetical protein
VTDPRTARPEESLNLNGDRIRRPHVGPHLAVPRERLWGWAALPLGGGAVAVGERLRAAPGLERLLVAPAGDHQPLLPAVGGLEQLEPLEAVGVVDGPGSGSEPLSQLVARLMRHRDRIDLNDGHDSMLPTTHHDSHT